MASSSSLVVPLVMWGNRPPSHCVSTLYMLRDQKTLVSGSSDGQVFLWEVDTTTWEMTPRHVLMGHTAPVRCIAKASGGTDCHHVVTSSENGEMFTWDTVDGRCIESKKWPGLIHTSIQSYRSPDSHKVKLFCCGFYEEIVVIDPFTLMVMFRLSSRMNPDWISVFHVLRPRNRHDDVVLALTTTGSVKVWTLNGDETDVMEPILENESKQISCVDAVSLTCCVYNMRTVLIVCSAQWSIYDAGDFTCLLTVRCNHGERWVGGEFISAERIAVWSDDGRTYLYRMPTNCIVESKDFHNKSSQGTVSGNSLLFCLLSMDRCEKEPTLDCPPTFRYMIFSRDGKWMKYLMRGDANGRLAVWKIPDTPECASMQLNKDAEGGANEGQLAVKPFKTAKVSEIWERLVPPPPGIFSQLDDSDLDSNAGLTATIFLSMQCRLVCGRGDGSIVMVPATQTVMLNLLAGRHQKFKNWPQHQVLVGHTGRVNCLLYPNNEHPRYDVAHLVSGSVDFTVCLWDIYKGALLHRFCTHAGEISSLYVPPPGCSSRIQQCVCSVASDHSVSLLSLKERRCVMLASRHLFPVTVIKWRPLDDFLMVGCSDGSTYVWQMETGHLDRVVHGSVGDEILMACDENTTTLNVGDSVNANPATQFFRGLRHRNLAAIKLATQSGISHLQGQQGKVDQIQEKSRAFPLVVNGFQMNQKDAQGHILFFDIEALIVQLLTEEYSAMSPGTMEAQGFTNQREYDRIWALTRSASPDAVRKISGFLNKVKDRADDKINSFSHGASPETQRRLTGIMAKVKEGAGKAKDELENAKREIEKRAGALDRNGHKNASDEAARPSSLHLEINLTLEIGQLLLSLLHAWGLDKDLDKVATSKLGLLRPRLPASYGIVSKGGVMSLMLPTWWCPKHEVQKDIPDADTYQFTALGHWELSNTITTNHLLSVIAITNTLISVSNASFIPEQERKRKLVRQATHGAMELPDSDDSSAFTYQQEQIKQGWSLLSTLHCLLLSGKLKRLGSVAFKMPQVELLAIRWQDRCLQIRLAAQELLVAELKKLGTNGRRNLVEKWKPYLPRYGDPPFENGMVSTAANENNQHEEEEEAEEDEEEETEENSSTFIYRRNQTTAVILFGVIGALFDLEAEREGDRGSVTLNTDMARSTAKALMYLVLCSTGTSKQTSLRRAAIDLIGRGFVLWEPHLEVSKVLLGLLEMTCEADWWVPSGKYGLPLTPSGDSCRTSRHALGQIALVRPAAFITSVAREIARFNNLAANAQALNVNPSNHVLARSKAEILHLVEQLIEAKQAELSDLLVDVVDIVLHCIDHNHLKHKPLSEVFAPICLFAQVSHCLQDRRIAVGTKTGQLALYEMRSSRVQTIKAHQGSVTAVAYSPDGKVLTTYSDADNKLQFWQTSTGMFGLGNAQTKCTRSYNTPSPSLGAKNSSVYSPKLVWISAKTVTLLLPDAEHRFNC